MKKDLSRINLRSFVGRRLKFTALVTKSSRGDKGKSKIKSKRKTNILLEEIRLQSNSKNNKNNQIICDHVWIKKVDDLRYLDISPPPLIGFTAKVVSYIKYGTKYGTGNTRILSWKLVDIKDIQFLKITHLQYNKMLNLRRRDLLNIKGDFNKYAARKI